MRRAQILAIVIASAVLPAWAQTRENINSPDGNVAIPALLKAAEDTWNRHDMTAFANLCHEDADWVSWTGNLSRGRAKIKEGHERIHRTYYKNSHHTLLRIEDLTFITSEIAIAHARTELSGDERSPGKVFQYRKTAVFTKRDGVWRIRAVHNTRLQEGIN